MLSCVVRRWLLFLPACRRVALYAVDSLRQLVAKLLVRAELEHFTHQEDALRPFVAVLRQCDEACVRELAVQCVMQVGLMICHLSCAFVIFTACCWSCVFDSCRGEATCPVFFCVAC